MSTLLLFLASAIVAADAQPAPQVEPQQVRASFLKLCDAMCPVLEGPHMITPNQPVQNYVDSYAVRALAVAYDMTGKAEYLDVCRRWSNKMLQQQADMTPRGAYYMNYGRKPGETKGEWFVADCASIGMGVLATAVRCPDASEKARYLDSVYSYAKLVMDNYVRPSGGITDGLWSKFDGEWWCSTGIFGSLAFLLYDETGDAAYLKVGQGAVDWLNRQRFENSENISFKEAAPTVLMYVFEAYSAGMPQLKRDPARWQASLVEMRRALEWMAANQHGRGNTTTWNYSSQWGSKLGGLPFHMYVWSRWLPDGSTLLPPADQELAHLGSLVSHDSSKAFQAFQLAAFAMMSYAERVSPGSIYRTDRTPK